MKLLNTNTTKVENNNKKNQNNHKKSQIQSSHRSQNNALPLNLHYQQLEYLASY